MGRTSSLLAMVGAALGACGQAAPAPAVAATAGAAAGKGSWCSARGAYCGVRLLPGYPSRAGAPRPSGVATSGTRRTPSRLAMSGAAIAACGEGPSAPPVPPTAEPAAREDGGVDV